MTFLFSNDKKRAMTCTCHNYSWIWNQGILKQGTLLKPIKLTFSFTGHSYFSSLKQLRPTLVYKLIYQYDTAAGGVGKSFSVKKFVLPLWNSIPIWLKYQQHLEGEFRVYVFCIAADRKDNSRYNCTISKTCFYFLLHAN